MHRFGATQHIHAVFQLVQFFGAHGWEPRITGAGRNRVLYDLLGNAFLSGRNGANAASQPSILVQRYKDPCGLPGQFIGQIIGQGLRGMAAADIGFQREPRQLHPRIFPRATLQDGRAALLRRRRQSNAFRRGL